MTYISKLNMKTVINGIWNFEY